MTAPAQPSAVDPAADLAPAEASSLPLSTRFQLGPEITPLQRAFLERHGFLVFAEVATAAEVARILA